MPIRTLSYFAALAVVAGCYLYFFTDLFRKPVIGLLPQIRPSGPSRIPRNDDVQVYRVSFGLSQPHALTEVKVVAVDEAKTNKYPHALWHLVSESNSVISKAVIYGVPIKGMHPKVPRARPEPLQPDKPYRLFVKAGRYEGQVDFKTKEIVQPAP